MTSAHSMQVRCVRRAQPVRAALMCAALAAVCSVAACEMGPRLEPPQPLIAPYERVQLWAVAPFNNESGVSLVQGDKVADAFTEQAEQVYGVNSIPVNRVLLAMRKLGLGGVSSHADAARLMATLGVDGLIVGTITSYDPYQPLKLGAAIQLYRREAIPASGVFDPRVLSRARTEQPWLGEMMTGAPAAQASGVFDARNHQTLAWLNDYARGRTEPRSAFGARVYLVRMELYTQFVAFRLVRDLLESEQARLQPQVEQQAPR